jgi:hypothetical protein
LRWDAPREVPLDLIQRNARPTLFDIGIDKGCIASIAAGLGAAGEELDVGFQAATLMLSAAAPLVSIALLSASAATLLVTIGPPSL